ncbi:TPA: hypothetical protein ACH7X7_004373, partial [Escherichia coli]
TVTSEKRHLHRILNRLEILGGLVLIGIGVQILWTHFHG